ncbi:MAG: ABC transporter ATP-binding protein [Lachnospiraceae bacterium]|nr:ABC transporter ATP-binding protein [Lachnospiraceae bacterium]
MGDNILELVNLNKSFGNTQVLKGLNIEIARGEFITILGSSGCGKTTMLRIIAGLEEPDSGKVLLNGNDITSLEPNKRNVNTVFQSYALFPNMNVEKNIAYGLKIKGIPKNQIKERVAQMLKMVQLEGFEKRNLNELSGGQRQRVAIARAVINQPDVLLLDEPLGALDLKLRRQMQLELKRFQKKLGITFIYITHDQEEAINMSDRIAVMRDGLFEQIGTPNDIYYHPRTSFVADFVGNANIFRENGKTYAIRGEKVLMNESPQCVREAVVKEKTFAGGQLKILFGLNDGQEITANRYGIDYELLPGEKVKIGWSDEDAVEVADN